MKKGEKTRLVADIKGAIIGTLIMYYSSFYSQTAYISTLLIHPDYNKNGSATKMIEAALKIAKEKKKSIVKVKVEGKTEALQ